VPKSIQQVGLTVTLQKLNVTQMIDAGHALQGIHPLMKMIGIDVRASQENNHLFDVIYRLAAFSGKPEPVAPTKGPNGKKLGGKAK
jgi:hypothetical protein